jgi:hypothetical protein
MFCGKEEGFYPDFNVQTFQDPRHDQGVELDVPVFLLENLGNVEGTLKPFFPESGTVLIPHFVVFHRLRLVFETHVRLGKIELETRIEGTSFQFLEEDDHIPVPTVMRRTPKLVPVLVHDDEWKVLDDKDAFLERFGWNFEKFVDRVPEKTPFAKTKQQGYIVCCVVHPMIPTLCDGEGTHELLFLQQRQDLITLE